MFLCVSVALFHSLPGGKKGFFAELQLFTLYRMVVNKSMV